VGCEWKNHLERFELTVTAPPQTPLRVLLPTAGKVDVVEGTAELDGAILASRGPALSLIVRR
jgi:hypothetical protein